MKARRLILWRHAKSDWHGNYNSDHDRPLNARGQAARHIMAAHIDAAFSPDIIVCSTAQRTRQTLAALETSAPISFDEALYHAMPATISALARKYGGDHKTLLMVGHNPGLEMLAAAAGKTEAVLTAKMSEKFPTCAVACLKFYGSWRDFNTAKAAVISFDTPKSCAPDNEADNWAV